MPATDGGKKEVGSAMDWTKRIEANRAVLGGRLRVRGTRLAVSFILEQLGAGASWQSVLDGYPQLTEADIKACLHCASAYMEGDREGDRPVLPDEIASVAFVDRRI